MGELFGVELQPHNDRHACFPVPTWQCPGQVLLQSW
jgi:hypothetical protein